jgi:DNA (cytosine-5)-methyltransferase 1
MTVPKVIRPKRADKPSCLVPSMAEIMAVPWNGLTVASTFSGCGGSSLGYRMAGFKVAWANEWTDVARRCYEANFPDTVIDSRSIRQVTAKEVLDALGMERGQLDLLDGSPPCDSFSTSGKRSDGWGKERKFSEGKMQRTDDLFLEYLRLVDGIRPRCFVAENVFGLVKGVAKGFFIEVLRFMKNLGYRVSCRVLDAARLGVPQHRQRTIFIGVRNDLILPDGFPVMPCHPQPLPWTFSVTEAIPWILTGMMTGNANERHALAGRRKFKDVVADPSPTVSASTPNLLFNERIEKSDEVSPNDLSPALIARRAAHLHVEEDSRMDRFATGRAWDEMGGSGTMSNKYFQLMKPSLNKPCYTVTEAGGNPSAASVCHPLERRKFSIAELKRICSFPDDFILLGSYAQQWGRLGMSVPPVMMCWIARTVRDRILRAVDGPPPWDHDMPFIKLSVRIVAERRAKT